MKHRVNDPSRSSSPVKSALGLNLYQNCFSDHVSQAAMHLNAHSERNEELYESLYKLTKLLMQPDHSSTNALQASPFGAVGVRPVNYKPLLHSPKSRNPCFSCILRRGVGPVMPPKEVAGLENIKPSLPSFCIENHSISIEQPINRTSNTNQIPRWWRGWKLHRESRGWRFVALDAYATVSLALLPFPLSISSSEYSSLTAGHGEISTGLYHQLRRHP